ncbi:MAG: DegT/DnrJ/EryC1/StrS family aminotransferase [Armatimonadota bacterium]
MDTTKLAIFDGPKTVTTTLTAPQRYGEAELQQVREAFAQNTLFYAHGQKVKTLCERFAALHGVKHCIPMTSCTAAIHVAIASLDLEPGDEVITSPISDMGTVLGLLWCQLVPVFADLDLDTHVLDPTSVEACITPRTRAILPVHLSGAPADLRPLLAIAQKHGLKLIEDCAQAYLAEYDGKYVGTFGDLSCFSLNEYKHISCGDGGMVLTNDDELAFRCSLLIDKGYQRTGQARNRSTPFLAMNYRMTELQGAVAVAQLEKLQTIVAGNRAVNDRLDAGLQGIEGLRLPKVVPGGRTSAWFYMMLMDEDVLGVTRDWFVQALQAEGVGAGAYIAEPLYRTMLFTERNTLGHSALPFSLPGVEIGTRYDEGVCPNAEAILRTCVVISFKEWTPLQYIDEVVAAIRKVACYCLKQKAGIA